MGKQQLKINQRMNTKAYLKKYGFLDLETAKKFNREQFLEDFGKEFQDRLTITKNACKKMDVEFTYKKFLNLISEHHNKFNSISNRKLGGVLSEDLFKAFYAINVIPVRQDLFPEEHEKMVNEFKEREKRRLQMEVEERERRFEQEQRDKNHADLEEEALTKLKKKGVKPLEEVIVEKLLVKNKVKKVKPEVDTKNQKPTVKDKPLNKKSHNL